MTYPYTRNPHSAPERYRTDASRAIWDARRIAAGQPHDRLAHRARMAALMGGDCMPVVWIYSSTWVDFCVLPGTAAAWHAGQVLASVMWRAAAMPMVDEADGDQVVDLAADQMELF